MTSTEPNPATETSTAAGAPAGQQEPTQTAPEAGATETEPTTPTEPSPGSEAAKYRTQLRATETERDTLTTRVETLTRREAARQAAEVLEVGDDLFDVGRVDLADMFDADGELDPVKVRDAARVVVQARPGLATTKQGRVGGFQGARGGITPSTSWSSVLRG